MTLLLTRFEACIFAAFIEERKLHVIYKCREEFTYLFLVCTPGNKFSLVAHQTVGFLLSGFDLAAKSNIDDEAALNDSRCEELKDVFG